jgi:hypothetical protein
MTDLLKMIKFVRPQLVLALAALALLAACNRPGTPEEALAPTLSVTQAYETVQARLTEGAALTPSPTPEPSPTPSPATSPSPTAAQTALATTPAAALATTPPPAATVLCDKAAAGNPIDVTIPDDTVMQPGQAFTKTWRLQNTGTCTWTKDYKVAVFSGDPMGAASSLALGGNVAPGQTVDISVDMVAPTNPGTYQGNWKLLNPANVWFGIGPSSGSPFWVRIVVVPQTTTGTVSVTPTPSQTPGPPAASATATPVIQAGGIVALNPGDKVDLDVNQVNAGSADLSYESNAQGQHLLVPLGSAQLGVFGSNRPSSSDCRSAPLGSSAQVIETLSTGIYFCFRTNTGLFGRAQLANFNLDTYVLTLDSQTWATP